MISFTSAILAINSDTEKIVFTKSLIPACLGTVNFGDCEKILKSIDYDSDRQKMMKLMVTSSRMDWKPKWETLIDLFKGDYDKFNFLLDVTPFLTSITLQQTYDILSKFSSDSDRLKAAKTCFGKRDNSYMRVSDIELFVSLFNYESDSVNMLKLILSFFSVEDPESKANLLNLFDQDSNKQSVATLLAITLPKEEKPKVEEKKPSGSMEKINGMFEALKKGNNYSENITITPQGKEIWEIKVDGMTRKMIYGTKENYFKKSQPKKNIQPIDIGACQIQSGYQLLANNSKPLKMHGIQFEFEGKFNSTVFLCGGGFMDLLESSKSDMKDPYYGFCKVTYPNGSWERIPFGTYQLLENGYLRKTGKPYDILNAFYE